MRKPKGWRRIWYTYDYKMGGEISRVRYAYWITIIFATLWAAATVEWFLNTTHRVKLWWWEQTVPGLKELKKLAGIK